MNLRQRLNEPIDAAFLAFFRIAFGSVMVWEVLRYFNHDWIRRHWIDPAFHFTYFGFDWLRPWPGNGMYIHFAALGMLAMLIALGMWYRVATVLFFVGFTYVFLLDQTYYLNHFYLICLLSLLLIWLPAHRTPSIDSLRNPALRSSFVPAWTLWLLRIQLGIVYFYGGVAKINADWLRGEPMRDWLAHKTDFPILGRFFEQEWMVYGFVYGGLLFDVLVVPCLLWRRTRWLAFTVAMLFHVTNARLFSIGVFPWFMIVATTVFFSPDWPRRLFSWSYSDPNIATSTADSGRVMDPRLTLSPLSYKLAIGFVLLQLIVPLRHWLYPGNVNWTEEGHRYSWRMKLRDKDGRARFLVTRPDTGRTWEVDPDEYLTRRQENKMSGNPEMLLQFTHFLSDHFSEQGIHNVQVRANAKASLNSRVSQILIHPEIDLAQQRRTLWPQPWIVPLSTPLNGR